MAASMADAKKRRAAEAALAHIPAGSVLGVGTGSTVRFLIEALAARPGQVRAAVSSSNASTALLDAAGIPVLDLNDVADLHLYVDGADEATRARHLIKGGGGALTREKIVAAVARKFICIADQSKFVEVLGNFPLPIEVIPFGLGATRRAIEKAFAACGVSGQMAVRKAKDGHVFVTDGGHWIVDAQLGRIADPPSLAKALSAIPGVVEHGLFIGLASSAVLAGGEGIRVIERRKPKGD